MEKDNKPQELELKEAKELTEVPAILEEITMEEMAVDGICGIY